MKLNNMFQLPILWLFVDGLVDVGCLVVLFVCLFFWLLSLSSVICNVTACVSVCGEPPIRGRWRAGSQQGTYSPKNERMSPKNQGLEVVPSLKLT